MNNEPDIRLSGNLPEDRQALEDIRTRIAECDLDIAEALIRRMDCVEEIINYKKQHGMIIFQGDQEKKQRHILRAAVAGHKHEEAILDVYREIIKNSRRVQARSLFPKNIYLVGFMGSGKTTVSGRLSRLLEMEEADTDRMIVNWTGLPVKDLFAQYGEEYFRDLETTTLRSLLPRKQLIISCGGGMTLRQENVDLMRENGVVVWLTATPETVYERVHLSQDRPLLAGRMNIPYIRELMETREPRYRKAADVTVPTDGLTILEICELLTKRVLEFQNADGSLF